MAKERVYIECDDATKMVLKKASEMLAKKMNVDEKHVSKLLKMIYEMGYENCLIYTKIKSN